MYNGPIIRSDPAKIQQRKEKEYTHFNDLWMKWRVVSTGYQLEVELVPAEHDLDY
jgi:hypothetical protein